MSAPVTLLDALLYPKSIAVIGASSDARKAGGRRWLSAIEAGFEGRIIPVSKTQPALNGFATFNDVSEVEDGIDLAVILVPTPAVLRTVEECARKRFRSAVIISAGFGETGPEGRAMEARLTTALREAGTRMLGPNSAGVFSAGGKVNCLGWKVPDGNIALITQSGNMAGTFTQYARNKGVGFASILAVGNSADLRLSELVELQLADAWTKAILIYCEGFAPGDGRRLVEVASTSNRRIPIIVLKPGASEAGRIAAKSHTGSLAGEDAVVSAAFEAAGIFRAEETEEAFDLAIALAGQPPMLERRLAVISDGGGHATVVADCAGKHGLELAVLTPETRAKLRSILPDRAATENPIDFAGFAELDPDSTAKVLECCLHDANVDGLVFAGHFGGYHLMTTHGETQHRIGAIEHEAAADMATAVSAQGKPVILHTDHGEREIATLAPLRAAGVPIFANLEASAKGMAALYRWGQRPATVDLVAPKSKYLVSSSHAEPSSSRVLLENEGRGLLASEGISVPEFAHGYSVTDILKASYELPGPLALKLLSAKLIYKSDAGGVLLNLCSPGEVSHGCEKLARLAEEIGEANPAYLITPMIPGGVEVIIGAKHDVQFGPIVLFGSGGILVEAVRDAKILLAPCTERSARAAVECTVAGKLLAGHRGRRAYDTSELVALVVKISELISTRCDITEIDLNPVIINQSGAHIADVRIVT